MMDPRMRTLAHNLINFSCKVKKGDNVLIEQTGDCDMLTKALVEETYAAEANPFVWNNKIELKRAFLMGCNKEQLVMLAESDGAFMEKMQAYIGLRGGENALENSDVPIEKLSLYNRYYNEPVHSRIRVPNTNWCVLRYPAPSMAQAAGMSTEGFEDHYFNVCNLDYSKMDRAMEPLKALMERTDKVRITAKDTDITFSIKGLPAIKCSGYLNIPDGEIFSAPRVGSINGVIHYNTPSLFEGFTFEDIRLSFKDGYITEATCNDTARINAIFDRDKGARAVGEFSIGLNPYINKPILDTLFDEKIAGSIHFTPGMCYDECDNGNKSDIHWDLVLIQTPAYGGGEIWFDDVLIRKDGRFVLPELECLNPEKLK